MHRSPLPALAILLLAFAPACSGAAQSDLLAGPGGGSSGSSGSGGSSGSNSGGMGGPDAGRPLEDAGTQDGTVVDAGNPIDAGGLEAGAKDSGGPQGPEVLCPQDGQPNTCSPGEFCCVSGDAQQGTQTDTCDPSGATCDGTPVHCARAADCPSGEVCCGTESYDPSTGRYMYTDVSCAKDCTGPLHYVFCDPQQQPSDCTGSTSCGSSSLLQGFSVCR